MERATEVVSTPLGDFDSFLGDHTHRQLKEYGGHQRPDLAMGLSQLRGGDSVVDVGGHIGTFAVPFARAVGKQGRVFSFEPSPGNFKLLSENAKRNGCEQLVPIHAIVTDEPHVGYREARHGGDSGGTWFTPESDENAESTIPAVRLDEWWFRSQPGPLGLLKIDVEGMEARVLRSADRLIRELRPAVQVEMSRSQLRRSGSSVAEVGRFLRDHGYDFFVNAQPRNAVRDEFSLVRPPRLEWGGRAAGTRQGLVDVLAVHRDSERYPDSYLDGLPAWRWIAQWGGRLVAERLGRRR
jgi:FkbM family methyltransferase